MRPARAFPALILLLAAAVHCPTAHAQVPEPGQLPGNTSFYLYWHGTPSGDIRKSNSLYALWDDPDFASARSTWMESFWNEVQNNKPTAKSKAATDTTAPKQVSRPKLTREEFAQYITLLDNPFVIGAMREPEALAAKRASGGTAAKDVPAWNGVYFIYDRWGKEELLSKAVLRMRGQNTSDIPKLTEITAAGVPALKIESKSGVSYWAEFGKHAVGAQELSVFEQIIQLVNGKPAATTLAHSPAYEEAKPLLGGGVLEFFVAIPNLKDIALESSSKAVPSAKPLLDAIKLDALHSLAGHVVLDGPKTHLEGAILGDTTPGSLFDIWADGLANPASLPYVSPDTIYYSESQFNLPGIYQTIKHAFQQGPQNSAQLFVALESMAQTRIGMPLPDALAVPSGEIAWLQTSPTFDDSQKLYLFGITDKTSSLRLARSLLGDRISSEKNEGDATFLKISLGGTQSAAGIMQYNFYYLAVTPSLIFGSSRSDNIRKYLGQSQAADSPVSKNILGVRSKYPEKLNGFSYFDFQKVDWPALKAKWIADAKKSADKAKSNEEADRQKKFGDWLAGVNPDVFPRHLHIMAGASWKDTKGVHFDEWLQ